jgi:hypothetical protein
MLRRNLLRISGLGFAVGSGLRPINCRAQAASSVDLNSLNRDIGDTLNDQDFLVSLRVPDESVWRNSLVRANHGMFGTRRENRNMPEDTVRLIIAQEVGSPAYFSRFHLDRLILPGDPSDPANHSGPTIGMGYDIGQLGADDRGAKNLHDDWDAFISKEAVSLLIRGLGLQGQKAKAFVNSNRNLSVPWQVADNQLRAQMLPYLLGDLLNHLPSNAGRLPDRCMARVRGP